MPEHEDVEPSEASDVPRPEPLRTFFRVDEICREDGRVRYVGESYFRSARCCGSWSRSSETPATMST